MSKFLLEQVKEPFDHFVFTAGDSVSRSPIAELDFNRVAEGMDVRYWAPFAACKILKNSGLLKEGGSITLTSGILVIRPQPGSTVAVGELCSRHALESLQKDIYSYAKYIRNGRALHVVQTSILGNGADSL